jgi:hypothetical protein
MTDSSHVWRVFGLLGAVAAAGFLAQRLLKPKSFGELGHYRADAVREIMDLELVHQGKEVCGECHEAIHQAHVKDIHFRVPCEDCHGPGQAHVKYYKNKDPLVSKAQATMPREYTLEGCLFCHRKLAARPRSFAQIDPVEHYQFLHVNKPETRCIECHSPHEPLFLVEEVNKARIHPVILECEDCHDGQPRQDYRTVPDHPAIFVCRDCHPAVVKDFAKRAHSFLRCTACHTFYRETETSGRILKNGNRRFCLLCHEDKPFKDKEAMPQIAYADHLTKMAKVMRREPAVLGQDPTMCLTCHFDFIHDNKLIKTLEDHGP